MKDYHDKQSTSDEDDEIGFVMYSSMDDPTAFEETYKEDKWKKTM